MEHGFIRLDICAFHSTNHETIDRFSVWSNMRGRCGREYEWDREYVQGFWGFYPAYWRRAAIEMARSGDSCHRVVDRAIAWMQTLAADFPGGAYVITENAPRNITLLKAFSSKDITYMFGDATVFIDVEQIYMALDSTTTRRAITSRVRVNSYQSDVYSLMHGSDSDPPQFGLNRDPASDLAAVATRWVYIQELCDSPVIDHYADVVRVWNANSVDGSAGAYDLCDESTWAGIREWTLEEWDDRMERVMEAGALYYDRTAGRAVMPDGPPDWPSVIRLIFTSLASDPSVRERAMLGVMLARLRTKVDSLTWRGLVMEDLDRVK